MSSNVKVPSPAKPPVTRRLLRGGTPGLLPPAAVAGEERLLTLVLLTVAGRNASARVQVPAPRLPRLKLGEQPPAAGGVFRVLTVEAGDERYCWDNSNLDSIRRAKEFFNTMVAQGMVPFRVGPRGVKADEPMREFDPLAEEVIFAPIAVPQAVVGG